MSCLVSRNYTLLPRESVLTSRNYALLPRDSLLLSRNSLLTSRDCALLPRNSSLTSRNCSLLPRDSLLLPRNSLLTSRKSTPLSRNSTKFYFVKALTISSTIFVLAIAPVYNQLESFGKVCTLPAWTAGIVLHNFSLNALTLASSPLSIINR